MANLTNERLAALAAFVASFLTEIQQISYPSVRVYGMKAVSLTQ